MWHQLILLCYNMQGDSTAIPASGRRDVLPDCVRAMSKPFSRDNSRKRGHYLVSLLSGRHSFYSLSLFLLSLLMLVSACGINGNTSSANAASSPLIVSNPARASITDVAATNEVVYLAGSDGSITARQADNGTVIWHQAGLPALPRDYIDLVPTAQVLYDAYETTATSARVEARHISNGLLIWSQVIPHHLGPGYVTIIADADMIYVNTILPENHGLLYALRSSGGQIRWQYPLPELPMNASVYANDGIVAVLDNPATGSTHVLRGKDGSLLLSYTCPPETGWRPEADDTAFYIYCGHRPLQAFRISDGALLWTAPNSSQIVNDWRESQRVIYSDTGTMLQAFRTQDGTLLWQTPLPIGTFGPSLQGQLVAVMTPDFVVMAFHASNGTLAWKRSLSTTALNLTPGSVYTNFDANGFFLFGTQQAIHVWRSSDGQDIWHGTTTSRIVWQPRVVNRRLYLWQFDGTLEVVDLQSGTVLWSYIA